MRRREWMMLAGGAGLGPVGIAKGAVPEIELIETKVISLDVGAYHGWPTVVRRANGQLVVVSSSGRESHVCPFGRVEMIRSDDEGKSWTWPRVLLDSGIDDRDAGVLETAKGSLLVTTFTSLAYEASLAGAKKDDARWQAVQRRLSAEERQRELGQWMIRSTDGGVTWSERYATIVNSPHGPIQLADGRLLYAGKELWTGGKRVGVCESADDGVTWTWLAEIPVRPGDAAKDYHELHAVEAGDGRIVVQIRNHNAANSRETLQCESTDGGKSWSVPAGIGVWGLPSHLLRLRDGRLLMSYGHRRKPFGNQARVSGDGGRRWSEPVVISGDGIGVDLGYPSTVELEGGDFLTVWYERMAGSAKAVLRQARWRMKE
ncbi:MAG: sialidase family protein [Verrucomicrobiales bacterium]|nr:sialidase family protein [Verrucomicrobiales bacterium]